MLFYLGLRGLVNGGSREEPPQITQKGKPVRRRFSQMAADQNGGISRELTRKTRIKTSQLNISQLNIKKMRAKG